MLEWLGEMHWWWLNLFAFLGNMLGVITLLNRYNRSQDTIDFLLGYNETLVLRNLKVESELDYLKSKYGEKQTKDE